MEDKHYLRLSHIGKNLTKDRPVTEYNTLDCSNHKTEYVFPVKQHIGSAAAPIVGVGDIVKRGQLIAKGEGLLSADIHSSVNGKIVDIGSRLMADGTECRSIVIHVRESSDMSDYVQLTDDVFLNIIRKAGIVGMGGAGYPTYAKYASADSDRIEYVIVNGAECEPYITADYCLMKEKPENIAYGIQEILRYFKRADGIIAIEDKTALSEDLFSAFKVKVLSPGYPQGAEKKLVRTVTGRHVGYGQLPVDVGCIVSNVHTVSAIYEAVCRKKPLIDRVITITGDKIERPGNYRVPLGISCREVLRAAGFDGYEENGTLVIIGGPMMGYRMQSLDVPVTKTVNGIICIADVPDNSEPGTCIRCGRCNEVCPVGLSPVRLAHYVYINDRYMYDRLKGHECIKCGCCSYVCPAGRELTRIISGY